MEEIRRSPVDIENIPKFHRISYTTEGAGFLPPTVPPVDLVNLIDGARGDQRFGNLRTVGQVEGRTWKSCSERRKGETPGVFVILLINKRRIIILDIEIPSLKLTVRPLKFPFGFRPISRGELLVLGRVISIHMSTYNFGPAQTLVNSGQVRPIELPS